MTKILEEIKKLSEIHGEHVRRGTELQRLLLRTNLSLIARPEHSVSSRIDASQDVLQNPLANIHLKIEVAKQLSRLQKKCLCADIKPMAIEALKSEDRDAKGIELMTKAYDGVVFCFHCMDTQGLWESESQYKDREADWEFEMNLQSSLEREKADRK